MKLLTESVSRTSNAWTYKSIWQYPTGYKAQVLIHRDAYDRQSYATATVWSDRSLSWNLIADIPYPLMESIRKSTTTKQPILHPSMKNLSNEALEALHTDQRNLLHTTGLILGSSEQCGSERCGSECKTC